MRNRLGYVLAVTLLGTSALMGACSDDASDGSDNNGGEPAGGEPSSGGSSSGKAGSTNGGKAGSTNGGTAQGGDMTDAGAGGTADAGAGGDAPIGGAPDGMGGANLGGADAGAGGGGNPEVTYACTANSLLHKVCSAYAAAECSEGIECPDCVADRQIERSSFTECATCLAEFDKYYQCAIDAHEAGNVSAGVQCFDGFAEPADACLPHLDEAFTCQDYIVENDCPAMWPPP